MQAFQGLGTQMSTTLCEFGASHKNALECEPAQSWEWKRIREALIRQKATLQAVQSLPRGNYFFIEAHLMER